MKKLLFCFMLLFPVLGISAQEEVASTMNDEIEKKVNIMDIEGVKYNNVTVRLKSSGPDYFTDKHIVKVTIKDSNRKKIYDKTYKKTFMYIFSDGSIQVGKPNFDKIVIQSLDHKTWYGIIREKEGVFEQTIYDAFKAEDSQKLLQ